MSTLFFFVRIALLAIVLKVLMLAPHVLAVALAVAVTLGRFYENVVQRMVQ